MNRRGFIGSILALGAAPAIVRADSLMRLVTPQTYADGLFVVTGVRESGFTVVSLNIDQITREALRIAHDKMKFLHEANWPPQYGDVLKLDMPRNAGDTIRIRMPGRYE